ncbi:MAG: hypothetical protein WDN30_00755 [Pararobbsia sp.]
MLRADRQQGQASAGCAEARERASRQVVQGSQGAGDERHGGATTTTTTTTSSSSSSSSSSVAVAVATATATAIQRDLRACVQSGGALAHAAGRVATPIRHARAVASHTSRAAARGHHATAVRLRTEQREPRAEAARKPVFRLDDARLDQYLPSRAIDTFDQLAHLFETRRDVADEQLVGPHVGGRRAASGQHPLVAAAGDQQAGRLGAHVMKLETRARERFRFSQAIRRVGATTLAARQLFRRRQPQERAMLTRHQPMRIEQCFERVPPRHALDVQRDRTAHAIGEKQIESGKIGERLEHQRQRRLVEIERDGLVVGYRDREATARRPAISGDVRIAHHLRSERRRQRWQRRQGGIVTRLFSSCSHRRCAFARLVPCLGPECRPRRRRRPCLRGNHAENQQAHHHGAKSRAMHRAAAQPDSHPAQRHASRMQSGHGTSFGTAGAPLVSTS